MLFDLIGNTLLFGKSRFRENSLELKLQMGNQRPRSLLRLCREALLALGLRVIDLHSPARSPFTGRIRTVDHHVGIVARAETGGK